MNHVNAHRFIEIGDRVGLAEEKAHSAWEDLTERYAEEHRAYHNLDHVDRMLSCFDASGAGTDAIELAIWYHDVIYEPLGSHNEAKSAQHFEDHVGSVIGGRLVGNVRRLILATDPTRSRSGRDDEDLIVDIDLSILGASPEDYDAYRKAVRQEYSSVSDADFSAGRRAALERFLSQRIYATDFFARLEQQARLNMKGELEGLKSPRS